MDNVTLSQSSFRNSRSRSSGGPDLQNEEEGSSLRSEAATNQNRW